METEIYNQEVTDLSKPIFPQPSFFTLFWSENPDCMTTGQQMSFDY